MCARSFLQERVRLGQVLAVRALALVEVGHGVEAQAVDAHLEPEVERLEDRLLDARVVEVQVRLVASRSGASSTASATGSQVQFEGSKSLKMMRASWYCVGRVAPDVEVALGAARRRAARALEPRVLVGGVVDDQLGDDAQAAAVRLAQEVAEVVAACRRRVDVGVVGDVVAVVLQRRGVERQQPDRGDAEVLEVVELRGQAAEVADAVAVAVVEGADVQLVDDRVLVPERVVLDARGLAVWPGIRGARSRNRSCSASGRAPNVEDRAPARACRVELDVVRAPPCQA